VSDTIGYHSRLSWEFRPGAHVYVVLNQNVQRDETHLTLLESALTAKINAAFTF
jgi:hypothetical protein